MTLKALFFVDPIRSWGCWIDDSGDANPFRVSDNDSDPSNLPAAASPFARVPQPNTVSSIDRDPFSGRELSTLAFREFGMVRLERRAGAMTIQFDLESVAMGSISGARTLLRASIHQGPIVLAFKYGGWARERFSSIDKALSRMMQLCAHRGAKPDAMISSAEFTLEEAQEKAHPLIRRSLNAWRKSDRNNVEAFSSDLFPLRPYLLSLSENNSRGNLSYRQVGDRSYIVRYLGRDWARGVIGTLSDYGHSDTEFEQAISDPYFEALDTETPIFGHVRGLFALSQKDSEWVSYQRVVLPYHTNRGKRALAILVVPDQNVQIPFLGRSGPG